MEIDCPETLAAAFVDGGIQDVCDNGCSICLENFTESDPSAVTNCNHQYHLHCILEWCQRSSNCPMCWQQISLKERTSQELLEAIENEKKKRARARREFQFPASAGEAEIEERILQHLAAAMGRQYRFPRRGERSGSSSLGGHSRFTVFSLATAPSGRAVSSSLVFDGNENEQATIPVANDATPLPNNTSNISNHRNSTGQSSVGPSSEFQVFSEYVRSRLGSLSMRYRESIVRSTRSWKERLFAHSNSSPDLGSEDRRDGRNRN